MYKRSLFLYLMLMGSFITFFNDNKLMGLPPSTYALFFQVFYLTYLIRTNPYRQCLRIHALVLYINHSLYLIFLVVINLVNFILNIDEIVILGLGYLLTGSCGCLVVLSIVRLYYEYRYGEKLEK